MEKNNFPHLRIARSSRDHLKVEEENKLQQEIAANMLGIMIILGSHLRTTQGRLHTSKAPSKWSKCSESGTQSAPKLLFGYLRSSSRVLLLFEGGTGD